MPQFLLLINQRPEPKYTKYASENIFSFRYKSRGIKPIGGNKHLYLLVTIHSDLLFF